MNELQGRYKERGLFILALSSEQKGALEPFVAENRIEYPVGCGSSTSGAYGVRGIPDSYLIGADGKVIWNGHPSGLTDAMIEAALSKVSGPIGPSAFLLPDDLPESFAAVRAAVRKRQLALAIRTLEGMAGDGGPDADRALALHGEMDGFARARLDAALAHRAAGRLWSAAKGLEDVQGLFRGMDCATEAGEALRAVRQEPGWRAEQSAQRILAAADRTSEGGRSAEARKQYEMVIERYPETEAAASAREHLGAR
ncbi:MAG: hypothetical protein HY608_06465 [Planctomycetes bacterium]|nr:hypothetical protein [Planctomycetota bacterium]